MFQQRLLEIFSATIHEDRFIGSELVTCGQTDRQTDTHTHMAELGSPVSLQLLIKDSPKWDDTIKQDK
jgi:hypothetical protein